MIFTMSTPVRQPHRDKDLASAEFTFERVSNAAGESFIRIAYVVGTETVVFADVPANDLVSCLATLAAH